jgi:predicted DNA-binding WGR domain protein
MPRYEFSEGTSNKFWEINLGSKQFSTTYGKIGTDGQTTIKTFPSDADAKKEHDKLVAEKTKKGYALVGGGKAKAKPAPVEADEDDDDDEDEKPAKKPAAKAAPAKAAPAKAAPPAKAAAPAKAPAKASAPRYFEFSEGTSNKFWEITLDGNSVKTRYGKIGTGGQQTLKTSADAAGAKKEYDKLVAEKTKKGYEETTPSAGGGDDEDDE